MSNKETNPLLREYEKQLLDEVEQIEADKIFEAKEVIEEYAGDIQEMALEIVSLRKFINYNIYD